jgi:acetyltransferase EpsM
MIKELPVNARIFLFGASGHAKVIIDTLRLMGLRPVAIIDDNVNIKKLYDFEIFHDSQKAVIRPGDGMIVSVGDNMNRRQIVSRFTDIEFVKAFHPSAVISATSILGEGTVIMANTTVNADSIIGKHCIINTNASVDHDCTLGDYVHISPNVALAGNVTIGEGTQIGIGATVIQNIRIGKWTMIGAGSVIIRDVPDYAVVVGNPGRIIKYINCEELSQSGTK